VYEKSITLLHIYFFINWQVKELGCRL
jgi:hypothetical protein